MQCMNQWVQEVVHCMEYMELIKDGVNGYVVQ